MIKKLILIRPIIFAFLISLAMTELPAHIIQQPVQPAIAKTTEEPKSRLIEVQEKFEDIFEWCKENPRKAMLIAGAIVLGTGFLIKRSRATNQNENNLLDVNKSLDIKFDKKFIDRPHSNDGKLPNGNVGPINKTFENENCFVSITQLPGLVQTRHDCGYYALFALKCFAEENEKDLTNRELYQQCEIEWKNKLLDKKYSKHIDKDLSWIEKEAMEDLINQTSSLSKVKENFNQELSTKDCPLLHKSLTTREAFEHHLENTNIEKYKPLLFAIRDSGAEHWFASKVVFKDKNNIDLIIFDSYRNGTKAECVKHMAEFLAKRAAKLKS